MAVKTANKRIDNVAPGYDAQGDIISLLMRISYDIILDDPTINPPRIIQRVGLEYDAWPDLNAGQRTALTQVFTRLAQLRDSKTP